MFTGLQDTGVTKGNPINFTGKYVFIKLGIPNNQRFANGLYLDTLNKDHW